MRNHEKRRVENLDLLIREAGSARTLARLAGTSASYLSQLRHRMTASSGRPRAVGNALAARLERALGTPAGGMDEPQGGEPGPMEPLQAPCEDVYGTGLLRGDLNGLFPKDGPAPGLCPLISWVQAGDWTEVADIAPEGGMEFYHCPVRCSPGTFVLRVQGGSMAPAFEAGELIFVDPQVSPDPGRYVVVSTLDTNEATFKQLVVENGRRYLQAANPNWPSRVIEADAEAIVCGVVVFKGKRV